jgi:hypothetical protein
MGNHLRCPLLNHRNFWQPQGRCSWYHLPGNGMRLHSLLGIPAYCRERLWRYAGRDDSRCLSPAVWGCEYLRGSLYCAEYDCAFVLQSAASDNFKFDLRQVHRSQDSKGSETCCSQGVTWEPVSGLFFNRKKWSKILGKAHFLSMYDKVSEHRELVTQVAYIQENWIFFTLSINVSLFLSWKAIIVSILSSIRTKR